MEAGKKTINDVFNGNRVLEIPFFQRAYVWSEPQWERLLEDLIMVSERKKPYFLGSLILKQTPTTIDASVGDRRVLIDGQQRLTTLNILIKVLSLKLEQPAVFDGIFRLRFGNQELALEHNRNDRADFERVLNLAQEEKLEGKSQIIGAYNYFRDCTKDIKSLDLMSILKNVMFVAIELDEKEDAQQIFDTINSLGVRLTTAELLKNHLFDRDTLPQYEEYWRSVFEADEDAVEFWDKDITAGRSIRANIDLFLHSFLQIKIHDPKLSVKVSSEDKKVFSKVERLFESYKDFIQDYRIDKIELAKEIKEYATLYRENIGSDVLHRELPATPGIERINAIIFGLEHSTLVPYILYILRQVTEPNERNKMFDYLESYTMRRVLCKETTKNYNQLFTDRLIGNNVSTLDHLKSVIEALEATTNRMPTDEDITEKFFVSVFTNKQATGILYLIESSVRDSRKYSTRLKGLSEYSLEHLMPKKWKNKWSRLETEEQEKNRDRLLLTLGNLAIITQNLNSSLRDASWGDKKEGSGKARGLCEYASGLETMYGVLELDEWNEHTITDRSQRLLNETLKIWGLNTLDSK